MNFPHRIGNDPAATLPREGIALLASGSHGNAALVYSGSAGMLIDCGLSAKQVRLRIAAAGLSHVRIEAIVLTHEHADHVAGVRVLARHLGVPVLATGGTLRTLRDDLTDVPETDAIRAGHAVRLAGLTLLPFRSSHDAAEPVGFRIEFPSARVLGYLSDSGVVAAECTEALAGCHVLAIESNHDVGMLERGPYPPFLKHRIRSDVGHLSNDAAAEALAVLAHDGLATVVGLHLSETNNTPSRALAALTAARDRLGLRFAVAAALQHAPLVCAAGAL
ncbi:MAG: MBL fold metallo-hydrolase [Anaerosomatales bacterium]|nr:MBL fold metallo-hydrolase [Anaerosomatales bacterium]